MKKCQMFITLALIALIAGSAAATPILYVSSTTVPSNFGPGGTFGQGILTLNGVRPLDIYYADPTGHIVLEGVTFQLQTSLKEDLSGTSGVAEGLFEGGSITLLSSTESPLLTGEISTVHLREVVDGGTFTTLAAEGVFTVTGGSLAGDFGNFGTIVDLIFEFDPGSMADLTQPFNGYSDITLSPIPEPITSAILGLGLVGLVTRRRK